MNGTSSSEMIDKFHILNHVSLKIIIEDHLRFRIDRYLLKNYNNALELNLEVPNWEQEYKKILESCEFFKNELDELFFYNVLQAQVIILLMSERVEKNEIVSDKGVRIPMKPSIGMIATTPRVSRLTASDSGIYGGDIDLPELTSGSTIFLPVLVPGALLALGDCHAAVGDGAVGGTGAECGRACIRFKWGGYF